MRCRECKVTMPKGAKVCPSCNTPVSVDEATLDQMVSTASIPSLATLFKKAKDQGVITAEEGYKAAT